MHMCIRFAAKLYSSFRSGGPLLNRPEPYDWAFALENVTSEYERRFNSGFWICVYNAQGRLVFAQGEHHPFLDVIEKCDAHSQGGYEDSVAFAETAFQQAGKKVTIHHDSNVALNLYFEVSMARVGVILRSADKTTTFNFSVSGADQDKEVNIQQVMNGAAAYLEGVQLAFVVGMGEQKKMMRLVDRFSEEEKKIDEGKRRLRRLTAEIKTIEESFTVNYRPERPSFRAMMDEAQELAKDILKR